MQSTMEVNLDNIKHNIETIKKYSSKEIIPVIKANAYGTYLNKNKTFLSWFNIVAVAEVNEAIELRKFGYKKEILVINQPFIDDIPSIMKYDITIGISSKEFINKILDKNIKCHLEIETGMNRTGINLTDLDKLSKIISTSSIKIEGIYTHFSSADTDMTYTNNQFSIFKDAINIAKKYFNFKYIHCSASNGILNLKEDITNYVRAGIILYGYPSSKDTYSKIKIRPAITLYSYINFIKTVEPNTPISYNQTFISKKKMTIATVAIGYGDGLRRCLSNKGHVIVNNKLCPIVGNICMDSLMIDISNIEAKIGDKVYILDNDLISLETLANDCETINYELICNFGTRIKREFKKNI